MTEIERLNPGIRDLLAQARRPVNSGAGTWKDELPILTLLHLTDPHGVQEPLRRIVAFMADVRDLFEDAVCTGDMVRKYYHTGYDFWHECGCDPILVCIGNHDVLNSASYDWDDLISQRQQAATFFEPYAAGWGVEYAPGTTYYCKRYDAHRIDLIVLNTMLRGEDDAAQNAFLREKLARALKDDTGVVIALHDTSASKQTVIPCRFSCLDRPVEAPAGKGLSRSHQEAVQEFLDAGGDFICYLGGHGHRDHVCYDPDFPRQVFFLGPSTDMVKGLRHGDAARVAGEKSEDAFNFVSFDRAGKTVKLIRVGADRDRCLRHRGVLCFDYENGKVLYED
ncbi:MAG: metallophosphoesterase [Oscillospiraceae bacterium]|nr:metallophosphoesterase [Oscillospiraceae bacterium]